MTETVLCGRAEASHSVNNSRLGRALFMQHFLINSLTPKIVKLTRTV
jgi:hypothetical protein